jgi:hypothetical protein
LSIFFNDFFTKTLLNHYTVWHVMLPYGFRQKKWTILFSIIDSGHRISMWNKFETYAMFEWTQNTWLCISTPNKRERKGSVFNGSSFCCKQELLSQFQADLFVPPKMISWSITLFIVLVLSVLKKKTESRKEWKFCVGGNVWK